MPILWLTVEGFEQGSLGRAMIGLYIYHVHPDVPFSEGALVETRIGSVIDPEHKVWDQRGKKAARSLRQLCATLSQPELILEVTSQTLGNQQQVQNLERGEIKFIDHLVVAEHLFCAFPRPVEILDGPKDEDALEGLVFGQTNGPVLLGILHGQECAPKQWRIREVWMVVGESSEFDHVRMLPQTSRHFYDDRTV